VLRVASDIPTSSIKRPICVLGMHRSGTSMVTRMLYECGVHLGADEDLLPASADDNREGYWENKRFVEINDSILAAFGGTWDSPPDLPEHWTADPRLARLKEEARNLVCQLSAHELWGWKDPRTCMTLPFWKEIVPEMTIVLCVRHPVEVAQSLAAREIGYASREKALALWHDSYDHALSSCGDSPTVVTHYISYFYEPVAELCRVLDAAEIQTSDDVLAKATGTVNRELWRGIRIDDTELANRAPAKVRAIYEQLRLMGGPVLCKLRQDAEFQADLDRIALSQSLRSIERLEEMNIKRAEEIARLTGLLNRVLRVQKLLGRRTSMRDRLGELQALWTSVSRKVAR